MRAVTIGVGVLAAVVAAGLGGLQAADSESVTFAVLRGDGVLIPIATRTGTKWSHTWPVPTRKVHVPLSLAAIPKRWWGKVGPATTWHTWQIDGTTNEVVPEQPTWYVAHCLKGVGLKTSITARPPLPPQTVQPYPKLGLAATSPVVFHRIELLDQSAPIWMHATDGMATALAEAEARMDGHPITNVEGGAPKHVMPAAERAKVPVRLEALYRMPLAGDRSLFYAEATKRYGMPPPQAGSKERTPSPRRDGCAVMTFGGAWFVAGVDGKLPATPRLATVLLTSCDYRNVRLMLPLGSVDDGSDRLWIAQSASADRESYMVLRWDGDKGIPLARWRTPGGDCVPPEAPREFGDFGILGNIGDQR